MSTTTTATHLYIILDRSGSMTPRRREVVRGYNQFLETQKALGDDCRVSVYFFSDTLTIHHEDRAITETPNLDLEEYHPCGMTALRDALGHVYARIADAPNDENLRRIILILTDGMENASKHVSKERLEELRGIVSNKAEIIYMGSNQDAIAVGDHVGATREASISYNDNHLLDAMDTLAIAVTRARTEGIDVRFTDMERMRSSGDTVRL